MEIRKQYNIGQLAEQLQTEVEKSKKYNGVVKLDILTAVGILDVLEEIGRMEKEGNKGKTVIDRLSPASPSQDGNKKAPENLKNGCDNKPMFRQCTDCLMKDKGCNRDCKNNRITAKMLRDRTGCFGDYDSTDITCGKCKYLELCREWRAKKEPCFGCYDDENFDSDCSECEYSIVCRRATNNA